MFLNYEFIQFCFVGVINTAFGYILYAIFIFLDFEYSIALAFATFIGAIFNFKTTGIIVFKNKKNVLIFKFICMYVFLYFFNLVLLNLAISFLANKLYSQIISLPGVVCMNFFVSKYWVFNKI